MSNQSYRVAVVQWDLMQDELSQVIGDELERLGHETIFFYCDDPVPQNVDVVFTFAPYGKLLPIWRRMEGKTEGIIFVHWNTEGIPDPRIPWPILRFVGAMRSWVDRVGQTDGHFSNEWIDSFSSRWSQRALRFRYIGDYYFAYNKGMLDILADSSSIYATFHNQHGLPTIFAPWGATPRWFKDMNLERDIDIIWMGQRGSKRRGNILDAIRKKLDTSGVHMYMADNVENPFIFGEKRIEFLNRSKIVLNITRTWYDDNYSRFAMAAPNKAMIISEPILPHCPLYIPGVHYVSEAIEKLPETIMHYIEDKHARLNIVKAAFEFSTKNLLFKNSIASIMNAVDDKRG